MIAVWITALPLFNVIHGMYCEQRQLHVRAVDDGDPVTLYCIVSKEIYTRGTTFWFKQKLGEIPQKIFMMQKFQQTELNETSRNMHITIETSGDIVKFCVNITSMEKSEEAIHYCVSRVDYELDFINGTLLVLKGNNRNFQTVIQKPASEPAHPGESVDLQCSVLSKTCPGEHSVYWFRAGSGQSHPGILYTHGNRSDECEKHPETSSSTQSCTYSLSRNRSSSSDAGTYYCAVAICGEILFGKGTKLDGLSEWNQSALIVGVISMAVGLVVCMVVIIILIQDRNTKSSSGKVSSSQRASRQGVWREECNTEEQDADTLNYAALHFSELKGTRGRRKDGPPKESVYSAVRFEPVM